MLFYVSDKIHSFILFIYFLNYVLTIIIFTFGMYYLVLFNWLIHDK